MSTLAVSREYSALVGKFPPKIIRTEAENERTLKVDDPCCAISVRFVAEMPGKPAGMFDSLPRSIKSDGCAF